MKKHAIIITVYKNFEYLYSLVRMLMGDFDIYVHVDTSSKQIRNFEIEQLKKCGCTVLSCYSICWGGINHMYAILELLKIAYNKKYVYYHIISGEDLPVRSFSELEKRFLNDDKIYITCHDALHNEFWRRRYCQYYLFVNKDLRLKPWKQLNDISLFIQRRLKINRKAIGKETKIYKGYVYGSIPGDVVKYVLDYVIQYPQFLKDLEYCFIPEEFFFQTILKNSVFSDRIAYNCLRYSVWEYKHGSIPGYLDNTDIMQINSGDYIFARKVNNEFSSELISYMQKRYNLDKEVRNEEKKYDPEENNW